MKTIKILTGILLVSVLVYSMFYVFVFTLMQWWLFVGIFAAAIAVDVYLLHLLLENTND